MKTNTCENNTGTDRDDRRNLAQMISEPITSFARRWSRGFQHKRSESVGGEVCLSKGRRIHGQEQLIYLATREPLVEQRPLYEIDVLYHQFLAAEDKFAAAAHAKSLASVFMEYLGLVADRDPAVLFRVDRKSEMPAGYHEVRLRNEELCADLDASERRVKELELGMQQCNARIQHLEGEKLALEEQLLKPAPVAGVPVEVLKPMFVMLDTMMNKYCDAFTGDQGLPAESFAHVYGAMSAISQELEQHMALPVEELEALKAQAMENAVDATDNAPARHLVAV